MYYYDGKGNPSGKTPAAPPTIAIPPMKAGEEPKKE
jgi:hypothetical protein